MKTERLQQIREQVERAKRRADRIMDGGDNYDGADGAREVQGLCDMANELIEGLDLTSKPI